MKKVQAELKHLKDKSDSRHVETGTETLANNSMVSEFNIADGLDRSIQNPGPSQMDTSQVLNSTIKTEKSYFASNDVDNSGRDDDLQTRNKRASRATRNVIAIHRNFKSIHVSYTSILSLV